MQVKRFEKVRKVATAVLVALVAATIAFTVSGVVSRHLSPKFQLTADNGFTITSTVKANYVSPSSCTGPTTGPTASLYPGITRCLAVTVHNPLTATIKVTTLSMVVATFTASSTTPHLPACTTTMVTPPTFSSFVPLTIAAKGTHTIDRPLALTTSGNQDNCENGTFHFTYSGSATYTDSTTTALTSAPNPSTSGTPVTFTAKVTAADASVNPTPVSGTVTFYACKTATCTLTTRELGTGGITTGDGKATYQTSLLPVGTTYVEAKYTGTTKFATSTSSPLTQVVTTRQPTLSKVTPSAGKLAGGTVITLTGIGFHAGTTTVTFGAGHPGSTVHVSGTTTLTVKAPSHGAGTVTVSVTNLAGTSGTEPYTYDPGPTLATVTPSAGKLAGGTVITLTGSGFRTGSTTVTFGAGHPGTTVRVSGTTTLTVKDPSHGAGTVTVSVTTPGGTSGTKPYTYDPVPTTSSVTPSAGPLGGGGTVTIIGTGFVPGATVAFGASNPGTTVVVVTTSKITVKVPAHAAATVTVTVTTPGGTSATSPNDTYTWDPVPTLSSLSPNQGDLAGGNTVTIHGTGFTKGRAGTTTVAFGSKPATKVTVSTSTTLVATNPTMSAPVQVNVTVTTPGGTSAIVPADHFTYVSSRPQISGVAPIFGPPAGGNSVVITGATFIGVTKVSFGTATASFTVTSNTQMTAIAPPGTAGAVVNVTATSPGGTSTISTSDQYTYGPTVTKVSPNSGPVIGGTTVTITGAGFTGVTGVSFGSTAAAKYTVVSATSITATSPASSSGGAVNITVTTSVATTPTSSLDLFTYVYTIPSITSLSTSVGAPGGGTHVTITGSGFLGTTAVKFGTVAASSFTVVSNTSITVVSPAGTPASSVNVRVTNPGGTSAVTTADVFTYGPVVTAVSPSSGGPGGGTSVTIRGAGFTGATAVHFGSTAVTGTITVNATGTQVTVKSPAGVAGRVNVTVTAGGATSLTNTVDGFTYS